MALLFDVGIGVGGGGRLLCSNVRKNQWVRKRKGAEKVTKEAECV